MKETDQMEIVSLLMGLSQMKVAQEVSMPLTKMVMIKTMGQRLNSLAIFAINNGYKK